MKQIIILVAVLLQAILVSSPSEAKNYTREAPRPTASDHKWQGYDYNFNLDESGELTGTNTFTLAYNAAPPKWYNDGYGLVNPKFTYTGYETLTITVDPGDFNYTYTLKTAVSRWVWDTHLLKWVRDMEMPYNGTRTFKIRDGVVSGNFEFPVSFDLTMSGWLIFGSATDGLFPSDGKIGWKYYDIPEHTNSICKDEIKPDGNETRINIETYAKDVLKAKQPYGTELGSDETGTYAVMRFPFTSERHDILTQIAFAAGIGHGLESYARITLPDVYYDKYVDPYAPVTKMLPNGHKLVTTLQPSGHYDKEETWSENGYDYTKKTVEGNDRPAVGRKKEGNRSYIHYIDGDRGVEEKGYEENGVYYMTKLKKTGGMSCDVDIDWSMLASDGHYVLSDNEYRAEYYCLPEADGPQHVFSHEVKSEISNKVLGEYVVKEIDENGNTWVLTANTAALSPQAVRMLKEDTHPYLLTLFRQADPEITKRYEPRTAYMIGMKPDGSVAGERFKARDLTGREKYEYDDYDKKWNHFYADARRRNVLAEMAQLVSMELDVPDYDIEKVDARVTGKRTAALLKTLCSLLKQKNNNKAPKVGERHDFWPNNAKKAFTRGDRFVNFKKVEIARIVKKGGRVAVTVRTTDAKGAEKDTELLLEDNIPVDEYGVVWYVVAKNTK